MDENIIAKVFYTPVQNPEEIRCIKVKDEISLEIINNFIKRIVNKKLKKPTTSEPQFSEEILTRFMEKGLEVNSKEVKDLFERLSLYMYGRAREQQKYWCLIITEDCLFIYHFTPDKAISFEEDNIREFIKYLDDSSLLKFIFKLKSEKVPYYFEELPEEELTRIQSEAINVYGIYDKSGIKGIKKLIGEEPEYEFKGELRIRVKRTDKTDIVVETFLDELDNINSNITFDFKNGYATIRVENAPITELVVDGTKYDVVTGLKRIKYENLNIGAFIEEYRFYRNHNKTIEFRYHVYVGSRRINKPDVDYPNKEETIFILGESVDSYEDLTNTSSKAIQNNFNVAFVELNKFQANYGEIDIGEFTIFAKLKDCEKIKRVKETFNKMIDNSSGNSTLKRTLHYVGVLVLSEFLKSKGFREKIYKICKQALSDYYLKIPRRNLELKEIDRLGIEFKAGIKKEVIDGEEKEVGFFDSSSEKFSKKIISKFKKKRNDTVIFFVGINEDTRDFSPIPLNRIRNEFHETLKENLSQN